MNRILILALALTCVSILAGPRSPAEEGLQSSGPSDIVGPMPLPPPGPLPAPAPAPSEVLTPQAQTTESILNDMAKEGKLLNVGVRIDAAFVGGGTLNQGFSIPGLRLAAYGDVGRHLNYRLTLGQTREFASVLLPQLLPVEAFINLTNDNKSASHLHWRIGIFRPSINPWWTLDLANISLPDYNEIHKTTLFANDIGTEFCFQPITDRIEITIGAFNGNGIFSLNSNNTKAFAGLIRGVIPFDESLLNFGVGAYGLFQGAEGSINFRTQWVGDLFASYESDFISIWLDYLFGQFNDSLREISPGGGSIFGTIQFAKGWKIFARYENLAFSPVDGHDLIHYELGPLWELDNALRVFVFYQSLQTGSTGIERSGQVRVRLSL